MRHHLERNKIVRCYASCNRRHAEHFKTKTSAMRFLEKKSDARKTLVVSDIDGTLVKGSLILGNAVDAHRSGVVDLGTLPDQWLADQKNEDLILEFADAYLSALSGKHLRDTNRLRTLRRVFENKNHLYSTIDRLLDYKAKGADVVLISGSPSFMVEPFAKHFGFRYLASEYLQDSEGRFTGEALIRANSNAKLEAMASLNPESYDLVIGFGDTASDAPLLEISDKGVLVDPNKETVAELKSLGVRVDEVVRD